MRLFGTVGSDSAPVEETMVFSSMSTPGTGGDDEGFGAELRHRRAIDRRDRQAVGRGEARGALDVVDLVFLEEILDAARVLADDLVLPRHHGREIEIDAGDLDAVLGERMLGLGIFLRGLQQRLRGNAADIEAGAAGRAAPVDAGGLEAELRRADRGDIAAGTAADDDDVVGVSHPLSSRRSSGWLPPSLPSPSRGAGKR
jgi:hypothetical protein